MGNVPSDWREAPIVPLYKKGPKQLAANYRPVSLTSVASKVLKHIVHSSIMRHFDNNSILTVKQHGFQKKRSTVTQLVATIQGIASSLHSGKDQVDFILLDFSKAFNCFPHQRLLYKLNFYGVRIETLECRDLINSRFGVSYSNFLFLTPTFWKVSIDKYGKTPTFLGGQHFTPIFKILVRTLEWIRSFLGHRKQQVLQDGCKSAQADVISGMPQGTVLGPLLFLANINDLAEAVDHSDSCLFADDCLVYKLIKSDADARRLQEDP